MAVNEIAVQINKTERIVCKRYVRCYTGRSDKIRLVVVNKLAEYFPSSTLWVAEVDFIKITRSEGGTYWTIDKSDLLLLEKKSTLKNLRFTGNYFINDQKN